MNHAMLPDFSRFTMLPGPAMEIGGNRSRDVGICRRTCHLTITSFSRQVSPALRNRNLYSPIGTLRRSPLTRIEVNPSLMDARPFACQTASPVDRAISRSYSPAGLPSGQVDSEAKLVAGQMLRPRVCAVTRIALGTAELRSIFKIQNRCLAMIRGGCQLARFVRRRCHA